jgi:hypothetical protein
MDQTKNVTASFFVDNTAPDISGVTLLSPSGTISDTRPIFTWTPATDSQSGVISYTLQLRNNNVVQTFTAIGTSYIPNNDLGQGAYSWTIKAYDAAGNESAYVSPEASFTLSTVDGNPTDLQIFLPLVIRQ